MRKSLKELRQELADYKRRMREDECDIGMMVSIVAHLREQQSLEIGTLKDEVYMLADEARQMSELLKRLDKIGTIDLERECLSFVKDTEYGVGIPQSYYGGI